MSPRYIWCAAVLATAVACGPLATPPDPPSLTRTSGDDLPNPSAVRELEVEHSETLGPSPTYRVRISDDGSYEYEGKRFVSLIGRRTGSTYPTEFSPLFTWLRDHPALYAASGNRTHVADGEAVTFRFGMKSGDTIVVEYAIGMWGDDYWALSTIVDGLIARALSVEKETDQHERSPVT